MSIARSALVYLTIDQRTHVGYELLDSGRGAGHRDGYHKLISNKREWNNCFINYQTLDKKYLEFYFLPTRVFGHFEGKCSVIKLSVSIFRQTTGYRIYTVSREPIRFGEIQYPVFGII